MMHVFKKTIDAAPKRLMIHNSLVTLFLSIQCERVIDVDLNNVEPRIVIEGALYSDLLPNQIQLSYTSDFFSPTETVAIRGGSVQIVDESGNKTILTEQENGLYSNERCIGINNTKYQLQVEVEGVSYEAESFMPTLVAIDSLTIELVPFSRDGKASSYVVCHFSDPVDEKNYYLFRTIINGEYQQSFLGILFTNDNLINGLSTQYPIQGFEIEENDEVIIQLISLDKKTYTYFVALKDIITEAGGGSPAAPANPDSQFTNQALGYFLAGAIDCDTIIIQNPSLF